MASNQPLYTCLSPYGEPSLIVSGASTTGTAASYIFTVQKPAEGDGTVVMIASVATGTVTACTATMWGSPTGGTPTSAGSMGPAIDLVNAPVQQFSPPLTPGFTYLLQVTTFTGTGTISVYASAH